MKGLRIYFYLGWLYNFPLPDLRLCVCMCVCGVRGGEGQGVFSVGHPPHLEKSNPPHPTATEINKIKVQHRAAIS